tara:strand:- start:132 stop:599 length:468 start_codon:yes stop_codon:yes gene_type:complete
MLKNIVSFIFIYIFIVSCENNQDFGLSIFGSEEQQCSNCLLEISSEDMDMDENGFYHLDFNPNFNQTFGKIDVQVGHDYEYVGWTTDTYYCIDWMNFQECTPVVNGASYSGSDGIASTMIGVHDVHIGMTVTVYCGYYDDYGVQYLDSIKVVIDE